MFARDEEGANGAPSAPNLLKVLWSTRYRPSNLKQNKPEIQVYSRHFFLSIILDPIFIGKLPAYFA